MKNPLELATYLLADDTEWPRTRILQTLEKLIERTVSLKRPLPVHLLYWTAWCDEQGTVHFRKDIYGRDARLLKAFQQEPPRALYHLNNTGK